MRTLDLTRRQTAAGVDDAHRLECHLREQWTPLIEQARHGRLQARMTAWEQLGRTEQRVFEARVAAWRGQEASRHRHLSADREHAVCAGACRLAGHRGRRTGGELL